jgi:hypothetical protein
LDAAGRAFAVLPDNEELLLSPQTPAAYFTFSVNATKHIFLSTCFASTPTNRARTTLGVGEQVDLRFTPAPPVPAGWVASAGGVSPAVGTATTFTAPSNGTPTLTVRANFPGASLTNTFTVVEPNGASANVTDVDCYNDLPKAAAGMYLRVVIGPTNVSLYRVQIMEVGQPATNVTGWFSVYGAPDHDSVHGANQWYDLSHDNAWMQYGAPVNDHAWGGIYNPPWSGQGWSGGSFTWQIPVKWKVGNSPDHTMAGWNQNFLLSASGTVTVTKLGRTATRAPNQACTTAQ